MTFLLYLGKVMLCSGILLGYYWLFLRNRRYHHYNRFYLQATLLLSILLPFLRIPVWIKSQNPVNQAVYQTLEVLTVTHGEEDGMGAGPGLATRLFTLENMLYLVYAAGIIFLLCMLVRSLLYIRRISKQYPFERIGGLKFFTTNEPGTPFSFFRSVFWNKELPFNSRDGQQIFRHELFHVQQKHSTDIIFTEIITAFFWFNPFFYLLKKEVKAIHEFLADQYAISENDRYAYAELLVLQTMRAHHLPVTNQFFQNHIKRRIAMITNNQSRKYSYGSRLMALPVSALLFCSIALHAQRSATSTSNFTIFHSDANKAPITVMIDAGHGGTDNGALSVDGKMKEKDLALQISQQIQQQAKNYNVNVVMTRTDDNFPGGATDITNGLRARTAMAEKINPDLYVSIHVSSTGPQEPTSSTGFEVWVSNKEENERTNKSKQLGSAVAQELSTLYTTNPALMQRSKNIWVLERTPCPAVLIECGYINNDKDLAFVSNSSNQEAIAKKILEGIVSYKNKPAAAVNTSANGQPDVATAPAQVEKRSKPAATAAAPALAVTPVSNTSSDDATALAAIFNDSTLDKLARHYRRNAWYPTQAKAQQAEGVVYFSVTVNENGELNNFQAYEQAPSGAGRLNKMTVVGYSGAEAAAAQEKLSKDDVTKLLQSVMKTASDRKPNLPGCSPQRTYFFEVSFRLEKKAPTV